MSADADLTAEPGQSWFVRAAGTVGDLSSPFYAEERQRDVWNEAAAVGLQLVLWLGMAVAAGMVWLGGTPGLPYAVTVLLLVGAPAWVSITYAERMGVRVDEPQHVQRLRLLPYLVLLLVFVAGVVRAMPDSGIGAGFGRGLVVGSAGAVAAVLWSWLRGRRRSRA